MDHGMTGFVNVVPQPQNIPSNNDNAAEALTLTMSEVPPTRYLHVSPKK